MNSRRSFFAGMISNDPVRMPGGIVCPSASGFPPSTNSIKSSIIEALPSRWTGALYVPSGSNCTVTSRSSACDVGFHRLYIVLTPLPTSQYSEDLPPPVPTPAGSTANEETRSCSQAATHSLPINARAQFEDSHLQ